MKARRDSNKGGIIWVKFTFSFPTSPLQGHQTQLFTQRNDLGNSELSEPTQIQTQINDEGKEVLD